MGTVLVAGASGALGSQVVKLLHARGERVRVLSRNPSRLKPIEAFVHGVHQADALDGESLRGACEGVDQVFSCLGAPVSMSAPGRPGFLDVDTPANLNLVKEASYARVRKFTYVSVFGAQRMRHIRYMDAHERVVDALKASGLAFTIVRPTGFFSALTELVDMAKQGRLAQMGDGKARSNPIHDEDLARVCVDAMFGDADDVEAGGPEVHTRAEMNALVFDVLGVPNTARRVPLGVVKFAGALLRPFHPRMSDLVQFYASLMETDAIAPVRGTKTLRAHLMHG